MRRFAAKDNATAPAGLSGKRPDHCGVPQRIQPRMASFSSSGMGPASGGGMVQSSRSERIASPQSATCS